MESNENSTWNCSSSTSMSRQNITEGKGKSSFDPGFVGIKAYSEITFSCIVVVLNIVEICLILNIKRRKTMYEKLLLSLSVADGLFGFTNGFQKVVRLCVIGELRRSIAEISSIIYFFFILSSLEHLLLISLDRLWAICSPLHHRTKVTRKRIHIAIASLWIWTTAVSAAIFSSAFLRNSEDYRRKLFYYIPMILAILLLISNVHLIFLNMSLMCIIVKKKTSIENEQGHKRIKITEKAVLRVCSVITMLFIFFTAPWAIINLVDSKAQSGTHVLLILNSAVNSIVYFFKGYVGVLPCKTNKASST